MQPTAHCHPSACLFQILDQAIKFYGDVLLLCDHGTYCHYRRRRHWADVLVLALKVGSSMRIAHLATADRIGFELFEFEGHKAPEDNLTSDNTARFTLLFRIRTGRIWQKSLRLAASNACRSRIFPDENHIAWFTSKTVGIVFELYSHSYEMTYSNGAT
jgi:hypothetical protein